MASINGALPPPSVIFELQQTHSFEAGYPKLRSTLLVPLPF